jgi:hypothetical protein
MNSQSEIKSFYIPRVYMNTTEQYIKYIFNLAGIGMPYRVDFAPCGISQGFKAYMQDTACYKSAFVHFHSFYPAAETVISFEGLQRGFFQTLQYEPYWRILKNRNPVHTSMMNSHQIVAHCCALEERVAQLETEIEYHLQSFDLTTQRISTLENHVYRLSELVLDKGNAPIPLAPVSPTPVSSHSVSSHSEQEEEEEEQEEEEEEDIFTPEFMERVSEYLDESWLNNAIQIVENRIQDITETKTVAKRERMLFTTDICGNE